MDNNKIDSWISAIVNEDGHNLSSGSLRTLKMIRYEIQKSCQPIEESEQDELWDELKYDLNETFMTWPDLKSKYNIIKR